MNNEQQRKQEECCKENKNVEFAKEIASNKKNQKENKQKNC